MQDNYTARCIMRYLQEVGITILEWPPMRPDMNSIEHAWDELGRRVRAASGNATRIQTSTCQRMEKQNGVILFQYCLQ